MEETGEDMAFKFSAGREIGTLRWGKKSTFLRVTIGHFCSYLIINSYLEKKGQAQRNWEVGYWTLESLAMGVGIGSMRHTSTYRMQSWDSRHFSFC